MQRTRFSLMASLTATIGVLCFGLSEAHAAITWVPGDPSDPTTSDIAVCNDGYVHAVRGSDRNYRIDYNYTPGGWRGVAGGISSPVQITCASSSWSPYQNRVFLQPTTIDTSPVCMDSPNGTRTCASGLYITPSMMAWDYWWYPDAPQNVRTLRVESFRQQPSAPNDNAILRFDPSTRVASVRNLLNQAGVSGTLGGAKRVASTTQNGRTVVVALK